MNFVALDCETHLIQPGLQAPPIVCGSYWGSPTSARPATGGLLTRREFIDSVRSKLQGDLVIAGANIAFDFGCVVAAAPDLLPLVFDKYERGEVWDVSIAMMLHLIAEGCVHEGELWDPRSPGKKLIDPSKGTITSRVSLAVCVDLCLGRTDAKENDEWRLRYAELEALPFHQWPAVAREYPVDDARNTYEVAVWQAQHCRNTANLPAQCAAAWAAHLSAMWGIRTDASRVEAMERALVEKRAQDVAFAKSKGFMREDGSKNMAVIHEAVTKAYNGNPQRTEKGAVSTAREVLEESGDEALERFSEVSKTEKLLKTYLPFVQSGVEVPINVRPNILLATGRASYDGLIQLLPRKGPTRECFVPRPGHVWCSVDYSAIELSTLAQVCLWTVGHSRLAEAINDGKDAHTVLVSTMTSRPYEELLPLVKLPGEVKDLRQAGKAANFGFPGGMGAAKFVIAKRKEGLRVCRVMGKEDPLAPCGTEMVTSWKDRETSPVCRQCVEAAEELRRFYLGTWTEMRGYFAYVTNHLETSAEVTQFLSGRVRGGCRFTQMCNTLFQGLAADGAKKALWDITRECYLDTASPLFGSRVMIFAHDELILEMPEEKAHEAALRQVEVMVAAMKEYVPDVRVSAEPALMRRWFKDAAPVYVDGRLVPWEPSAGS